MIAQETKLVDSDYFSYSIGGVVRRADLAGV
jgi:hypothetical protein